jgi:hypothetical protein
VYIIFFLEYAGELRIISLIEEEFYRPKTTLATPLNYICAFVENKTTY